MKKINYFGKEYAVGNDIKWVATCSSGYVLAFTEMPKIYRGAWVVEVGTRIDICGAAAANWEKSLRKVEDIIVKENELKVGDKVMVNYNTFGFYKGQIVELYRLEDDGNHLFKGDNSEQLCHCDGDPGAYLTPFSYTVIDNSTVIGNSKPHPHADMMLKYAMIAQYDDKPWECFECDVGRGTWFNMSTVSFQREFNYRLKPQEPKVQLGQIWVSKEGVDVMVDTPSDAETIYFSFDVCGCNYRNCISIDEFLQNFKRKE